MRRNDFFKLLYLAATLFAAASITKAVIERTVINTISAVLLVLILVAFFSLRRIRLIWPSLILLVAYCATQAFQFARHRWLAMIFAFCSALIAVLAVMEIVRTNRAKDMGQVARASAVKSSPEP